MRKALYFGSFNPIHYGHIAIAEYLSSRDDIDEVILIVSPKNPLKQASGLEDAEKRLERTEKEIEKINGNGKIHVSDVEFHLPSPLYTVNTLGYLQERHPDDTFILVIGEDNIGILDRWYRWEDIVRKFEIWVYPRPGYDCRDKCRQYASLPWAKGVIYLDDAPRNDISSTMIRNSKGSPSL